MVFYQEKGIGNGSDENKFDDVTSLKNLFIALYSEILYLITFDSSKAVRTREVIDS